MDNGHLHANTPFKKITTIVHLSSSSFELSICKLGKIVAGYNSNSDMNQVKYHI